MTSAKRQPPHEVRLKAIITSVEYGFARDKPTVMLTLISPPYEQLRDLIGYELLITARKAVPR